MNKQEILVKFNVTEASLFSLCQTSGVKNLYLFGSVLREDFTAGNSDIDFLVEFHKPTFDGYFDLLENLKVLFQYDNVDLVSVGSLKNKIIRNNIMSSREILYAA